MAEAAGRLRRSPWAFSTFDSIVAVLGLVIFAITFAGGLLYNFLVVLCSYAAVVPAVARVVGRPRRTYSGLASLDRGAVAHIAVRLAFWLVAGFAVGVAVIPAQFSEPAFAIIIGGLVVGCCARVAFAWHPRRRGMGATNLLCLVGTLFLAVQLVQMTSAGLDDGQAVELRLPIDGEAYVVHGGRSVLFNHHYIVKSQRHALDLVKTTGGQTFRGDKEVLASYPAWDRPVLAPEAGTVVTVVDDAPDEAIGSRDRVNIAGNHVVIDIGRARYVLLAHLRRGSIVVPLGSRVEVGDPVARIGNSGNTSEPHLHIQVQDVPTFSRRGVTTYPILFTDVIQRRFGRERGVERADPRRNDKLRAM